MPFFAIFEPQVALRKESVDRNSLGPAYQSQAQTVALRKESVDRNAPRRPSRALARVALRKESVDRNAKVAALARTVDRRSPQGERG